MTMWTELRTTDPEQQLANVFWKGPESQYFVGHVLSVETTELCGWSTKAAIDSVNGHDCVPMKLYLQKQKAGHSLLTPDVDYWS